MKKEFELGRCVITPDALEVLGAEGVFIILARHNGGDWEELAKEDREANEKALEEGGRIFSKYTVGGRVFWVITEANRKTTTILFPDEY